MRNTFFTADTHFGHANIIRYAERPFTSSEEMDEVLIENINKAVKKNDILYHLGDFSFKRDHAIADYRERINCDNIYFIYGNHDQSIRRNRDLQLIFHWCKDFAEISVNGQEITLCHYAMRVWNKSHHGTWQLYGHSHGSLEDIITARNFDVGVDCHNYKPLHFDEVATIISKKDWKPIDHHGKDKS